MSRVRNIFLWYTTFDIFASRSFTFNVTLWIYRRHTYYPAVTVIISFSRLIGIPSNDWHEEDWHKRDASLQAVSFSSIFGMWEAESRIIQFYFNPILFNSNITYRLTWFLQWFYLILSDVLNRDCRSAFVKCSLCNVYICEINLQPALRIRFYS